MFTENDVDTAVALIKSGYLAVAEIPDGDFKVAVQTKLTSQ